MQNKIKFDLQKYISKEYYVITRSGLSVEIAGVNQSANEWYKLIGWVNGVCRSWNIKGETCSDTVSDYDLFLIPKKKIIKGWANVYSENNILSSLIIYKTKEDAIKAQGHNAIGLIYIETELIPTK